MNHHGVLLLDKPAGITSHDVVARVRRILSTKAVGHAGTLDPMATGLLVLLIGEATKISDYLLNGTKGYDLELKFGLKTDTLDVTGQILEEKSTESLKLEAIECEAENLTGELELAVPKYSAIKVNGKKLLEKARAQETFDAPTRLMNFFKLELQSFNRQELSCRFFCSKGSYVRSWVQELGERLDCGATLSYLRRIYSSPYKIEQAMSLEALEQTPIATCSSFIPLSQCLQDWEAVTVSGRDEKLMRNGQVPSDLAKRLIFQQKIANAQKKNLGIRVFQASSGTLASLLEMQPNKSPKIKRVFRY
ncbi:MAG: tRNA pseudouridine(55) synthase TruB [Bdellovibrionales bacterium]|nr:tRNA pseudouridine(55) synthase TruB [Bdellovibrionales bacterium]